MLKAGIKIHGSEILYYNTVVGKTRHERGSIWGHANTLETSNLDSTIA